MPPQSPEYPTDYKTMPTTSFLDLPKKTRRRIYLLAGLPTNEEVYLNNYNFADHVDGKPCDVYRNDGGFYENLRPPLLKLKWGKIVLPFLLVSRNVSKEVGEMLYSENEFMVHESVPGDLGVLVNLSDQSLSSMKALHVHLRGCDCPEPNCDRYYQWGSKPEDHKHRNPLSLSNQMDKEIMSEWDAVVNRLLKFSSPSLNLQLICDSADFNTALRVVQPLHGMRTLGGFTIRLAKYHDEEGMKGLANETLSRVTGQLLKFSGYSKLPKELRLMILAHTNLVAPETILWTRRCNFHLNNSWNYGGCEKLIDVLCPKLHASASTICECHYNPVSIFLVSRQLKMEASEVFFGQNHFLLTPHRGKEINLFLGHIGSNAAKDLRSIELATNSFFRGIGPKRYQAWKAGLNMLSKLATVSSLYICLRCGDQESHFRNERWSGNFVVDEAWQLNRFEPEFQKIAEVFGGLQGLRDFVLDLEWFNMKMPNYERLHGPAALQWEEEKARMERKVESFVLGSRNNGLEKKKKREAVFYYMDYYVGWHWQAEDDHIREEGEHI